MRGAAASIAVAMVATAEPGVARAEADTFGLGNGHNGPKSIAAGNENINTYAPVATDVAVGATSITVGALLQNEAATPAPFAAGDLVLVWRATGVAPAEAVSGSSTRINLAGALATTSTPNVNRAGLVGRYEFARVTATAVEGTGFRLTLDKPMLQEFTRGVSQVVRVPEYTTVSVAAGASMRATAWQTAGTGKAGGILIFLATGAGSRAVARSVAWVWVGCWVARAWMAPRPRASLPR
ncbi:MAG: hypothetical protein EOO74_12145, partial [Myxococcales bacterium]